MLAGDLMAATSRPMLLALAHVCVIGGVLSRLVSLAGSSELVKHSLMHSAVGPGLLLTSFLLLDTWISWFDIEAAPVDAGDTEVHAHLVTISTFATVVVVETMQLLLTHPRKLRLNVFYGLSCHIMILVTYMQMSTWSGSGAIVWKTWYGSYFWPARINLWMHSSVSQILSFAATPNVISAYGGRLVMRRVFDTYVMFVLGLICTCEPPAWFTGRWPLLYTFTLLVVAGGLLGRVMSFMHSALPLCLHVPEGSDTTSNNRVCMRVLGQVIVMSWLSFPLIWAASALGLLDHEEELVVLSLNDLVAKLSATLALQFGQMASNQWEERTRQAGILEASHSMVEGFKLFTQCIGHDLRTPIQARAPPYLF